MISLAVSSQKGGVGKTTLSINLAYAYARAGKKTLLLDADPQGSVGLSLTKNSRELWGLYDFLAKDDLPLEEMLVNTREENFVLLPAGRESDYEIAGGVAGAYLARFRKLLRMAEAAGFERCVIDTPAGLFGLTNDLIATVDSVLLVQQAEPLGVRSVPKLLEGLNRQRVMNPHLAILGVVLTMVQEHVAESRHAVESLRRVLPGEFLFTQVVPRDEQFLRASARGVPVSLLENGEELGRVMDELRGEVEYKLQQFRNKQPFSVR